MLELIHNLFVQKEDDGVDGDGGVWEGDDGAGGGGDVTYGGDSQIEGLGGGGGNGDRGGEPGDEGPRGVMETWIWKRMEVNGIGEVVP